MPDKDSAAGAAITPAARQFILFGGALLGLALVAIITGIALLPFYHASAGAAHQSVAAMQHSALLRVLRAAHHWASALLILLGAALLVYGLCTAAYRRPLHAAWVAAVFLLLLFFGLQLTGHLLPWDTQAVSTAAIETGIAENAPVVGPAQARFLRGGGDGVSPRTLTLWYTAHVAPLPLALLLLAGLFWMKARRVDPRAALPWPLIGGLVVLLLIMALAAPAPLGAPATPADYNSFAAESEWYVLPLHALLTLAQRIRPSLGFVGTMVIPGLAVLWLLAVPWLDGRSNHQPPSPGVRAAAVSGVAAVFVLVAMSWPNMASPFVSASAQPARAGGNGAGTATVKLDPALAKQGALLFQQNGCTGCHKVGGQGGAVGPPLDGEGSRRPDLNWQIQHLKDPATMSKGSTMPSYKQLSDADLRALATYLLSLK